MVPCYFRFVCIIFIIVHTPLRLFVYISIIRQSLLQVLRPRLQDLRHGLEWRDRFRRGMHLELGENTTNLI